MKLEAYKKYWSDNDETLYVYSPTQVDKTKVDHETSVFLTTWGLPSDAAPFLNFGLIQENILMTPNEIFRIELEILEGYLMFGSNGSGDPVCIDTGKQNEVVYLNHDNDFERIFINTSIMHFGICLIGYREFIHSIIDMSRNDYSRRKFTDEEFGKLKSDFLEIDPHCLAENSFWVTELNSLLWERDNE